MIFFRLEVPAKTHYVNRWGSRRRPCRGASSDGADVFWVDRTVPEGTVPGAAMECSWNSVRENSFKDAIVVSTGP